MNSRLDNTHLKAYERDGFVRVPEFFDLAHVLSVCPESRSA